MLFSMLRPKKGLSNIEVTFVAFLDLNIGFTTLQPPESLHLYCYNESISHPSTRLLDAACAYFQRGFQLKPLQPPLYPPLYKHFKAVSYM